MSPGQMRTKNVVVGGIAALVVSLVLSACGSESGANQQQSYEELLHGLNEAAQTGAHYKAPRLARELTTADRDVLRAFCEFAWEIGVNREAWKLSDPAYSVRRVRTGAYALGNASLGSIGVAVRELHAVYDPRTFTAKTLERYTRACYA